MSRYVDIDQIIADIFDKWGCDPAYIANDTPTGVEARRDAKLIEYLRSKPSIDIVTRINNVECVKVVRKPIEGYEGIYEVDNLGRVFSIDRVKLVDDNGRVYCKPLKGKQLSVATRPKGYQVVTLTKDGKCTTKYVHRLVAKAFIPNPHGFPCVNHKDECPSNNCPENLEWCTVAYNNAYGTGRQRHNEKLIGRPLSNEHKRKIAEGIRRFYQEKRTKGENPMSEDRCICCGEIVPEGRMVCPNCEKQKPMKNLSHGEMVQIAEGKKNKTPRYIDANKLIDLATHEGAYGYVDIHDIYNIPTADVVERKKGFWEWVDDMDYRCSVCHKYAYGCLGEVLSGHYKYCPYCGSAMEGEEDDGEEIH